MEGALILVLLIPWGLIVFVAAVLSAGRELAWALAIPVLVGLGLWWAFHAALAIFFFGVLGEVSVQGWAAYWQGTARSFAQGFRLMLVFLVPISVAGVALRRATASILGG